MERVNNKKHPLLFCKGCVYSNHLLYIELGEIIVSKLHTNGTVTAGLISVVGIEFIANKFYIFFGTENIY